MSLQSNDERRSIATSKNINKIPSGTVFYGRRGPRNNMYLYLKTDNNLLVNLEREYCGMLLRASGDTENIENYEPLDVELVIHGPEKP